MEKADSQKHSETDQGEIIPEKTGTFKPSEIDSIPKAPGVYQMFDAKGEVIYVGKAKDLRVRVRQYFAGPSGDQRPSIPFIIKALDHIEVIVTDNEKEAFILENTLIKRHRPRYNVRLRDDKTYLSVRIDPHEEWPRAMIVRERKKDGALWFGPYTNTVAIRQTMNLLQKIFPLRSCSNSMLHNRSRPCLKHSVGRCCAPCVGKVTTEEYEALLQKMILFLRGRSDEVVEDLRGEMEAASEKLDFEKAAVIRDRIQAIEATTQKQRVQAQSMDNRDALGYYEENGQAAVVILSFREGRLVEQQNWVLPVFGEPIADVLANFIGQYYDSTRFVPSEICLPVDLESTEAIEEWLGDLRGGRVYLHVPQRGEKKRLVRLARKNAETILRVKLSGKKEIESTLEDLAQRLRLPRTPHRIECYDIATLQGTNSAGSKVCFEDGMPSKKDYQLFNIKWVEGQDDFAMMREVLTRRFRRAIEKEEELPDLVVIDGGKGQLSVAMDAFESMGIEDVPLAALVKEHLREDAATGEKHRTTEHVFLPGRKNPVLFPPRARSYYLLQRLRDEAHRFVNTHHAKRRSRSLLRSSLLDIPDVGPKRARNLLKHFGSLAKIKEASAEELQQAPGMSARAAEAVYLAYHRPADQGAASKGIS
ncbi:MAG: excinuclease ABC subunit UvrC [Candidatus Sumerlaeia bacterium]